MPTDIKLDETLVPEIKDGDFNIGESTRQHQQLLLLNEKGEIRRWPLRGVGIKTYLNEEDNGQMRLAIKREYEADGMEVTYIKANEAKISVDGNYDY